MGPKDILSTKNALLAHTVLFSLSLLQKQFDLGLLWFIINCFVLMLLLRAVYAESENNRLMCFYFYVLSIFTDVVAISAFGTDLNKGRADNESAVTQRFILAMSIILLLSKPPFAVSMYLQLRDDGIDVTKGASRFGTKRTALADQSYGRVEDGPPTHEYTTTGPGDEPRMGVSVGMGQGEPNYAAPSGVAVDTDAIQAAVPHEAQDDFVSPGTQ